MLKLLGVALATLVAVASPSHAATFITLNGSTGVFGNDAVTDGSFSDTIDLGNLTPGLYLISATISSTYQDGQQGAQDIDFSSVKLNGIDFTTGSTGQNEYRFVNNVLSQGQNLFSISGSSGSSSSYSGTVNIASVPEPSVWAMMMIGFGTIGLAMRRRRPMRIAALQAI